MDEAAAAVERQTSPDSPMPTAPEPTAPEPTAPEAASVQTGAGKAADDAPAFTPATMSEDTRIAQMSDTWVELEGTIAAAQSDLRTLLANRQNAEAMRAEAQEAMEQSDVAWQEAGLLRDAAWRAFERGFSLDSPNFVNRLRVIKEFDEARKAQAQLQRASNLEAWDEADRARQNATADILKALTALGAASAQISREVRETNYLPDSAKALRNAAMDDLRRAHEIGEELALLGQEALSQLGASKLAEEARIQERLAKEATARQAEFQGSAGDSTPFQEFRERDASQPASDSVPRDTPPVADSTEGRVAAPVAPPEPSREAPMSVAEQLRKEFEASTSAPPESTGETVNRGANGGVIEAGPAPQGASGAPLSVAEELERGFAAMRAPATEGIPGPSGAFRPNHGACARRPLRRPPFGVLAGKLFREGVFHVPRHPRPRPGRHGLGSVG